MCLDQNAGTTFHLKIRYIIKIFSEIHVFGKYLKFQVNSHFNQTGGLSYLGIFGQNLEGYTSIVFFFFLVILEKIFRPTLL